MKNLLKKTGSFLCMAISLFMVCSSTPVLAAENTVEANVSVADIQVDGAKGTYSFVISVDTTDAYAGAEFGVFCSEDVEITSVKCSAGSQTGPTEANGLVWFGYFAGEDKFSGSKTITVEGTFEAGKESALKIQDIRIYTIGDGEYATTNVEGGMIVKLNSNSGTGDTTDSDNNDSTGDDGSTNNDSTGNDGSTEDGNDQNNSNAADDNNSNDDTANNGADSSNSNNTGSEEIDPKGDIRILWILPVLLGLVLCVLGYRKKKTANE